MKRLFCNYGKLKQEIIIYLVYVGLAVTAIKPQKVKKNTNHEFVIGSLDATALQHINPIDSGFAGNWAIEAKDKGEFVKKIAKGNQNQMTL